jgi:hypothetical protein
MPNEWEAADCNHWFWFNIRLFRKTRPSSARQYRNFNHWKKIIAKNCISQIHEEYKGVD